LFLNADVGGEADDRVVVPWRRYSSFLGILNPSLPANNLSDADCVRFLMNKTSGSGPEGCYT